MTKVSTNKIGFIILSSFILISPLLANPAHSFNPLPGASISPQTSPIESAVRNSLIESNLLDGTGIEVDDEIELGDNIDRDRLTENILEFTRELDQDSNPRDEITRENLRELAAGSITNKLLSN